MLQGFLAEFVVGILVGFLQALGYGVVGEVVQGKFFVVGRDVSDGACYLGLDVDDGWPSGFFSPEEAEVVVGIVCMHETAHEVVFAGNVETVGAVGLLNDLVKVVVELWGDDFVGIDDKAPFVGGVVDGELAGGLYDVVFTTGKGEDVCAVVLGYGQGLVFGLHIDEEDFVEMFDTFEDVFKVFFGVVGVDDDGDHGVLIFIIYSLLRMRWRSCSLKRASNSVRVRFHRLWLQSQ